MSSKKRIFKVRHLRWLIYGLATAVMVGMLTVIWNQFGAGLVAEYFYQNEDAPAEEEETEEETAPRFIIQRIYEACGHHELEIKEELPDELQSEVFPGEGGAVHAAPESGNGWHIVRNREAEHREENLVTIVDELCRDCSRQKYLGVHDGKIAVFQGVPPDGVLLEVLEHEVKEVYREELEEGVPFETEEDKIRILESYTT